MDNPRSGRNITVTEAYSTKLLESVRRKPRNLVLEYSMWTLRRLADYLTKGSGIRVSCEIVRRELAKKDIVFCRPQRTTAAPIRNIRSKKGD